MKIVLTTYKDKNPLQTAYVTSVDMENLLDMVSED